jgi:hypothetical protein
MNTAIIKEVTQTAITQAVASENVASNKWVQATDLLVADGVKSSMLDKPSKKSDANPNATLQFNITQAIIKAMPNEWQSLISKETKTLSQADKDTKRYAQMQIGSKYGKIKRHLIERENPKSSAPRVIRSAQERIIDSLNDAIEVARDMKEPSFDVPKFIKDIKASIAIVK